MSVIYDCETFKNCFVLCAVDEHTGKRFTFEISSRRNDAAALNAWANSLAAEQLSMVGFNNMGFDYPVLHFVLAGGVSAPMIYEKAMAILNCEDKFTHLVYPSDQRVAQIDLFKIHHFDNKARMTSLKALEFNMRLPNIQDLPFPVGTHLTHEQMDTLIDYCWNDVDATVEFYHESKDKIEFRQELSALYNKSFMNHNDVKIGKEIFQINLEASGVVCYEYGPNGRTPKQTLRHRIDLHQCVPSYAHFDTPEFNRIKQHFQSTSITVTKGAFADLTATVAGMEFKFGTGGIHASVESESFVSNDTMMIYDVDVTSLYPSLAIENHYYPEHLGEKFVEVYKRLRAERVSYAKGTPQNAMLKLALNGVYGASNDAYSIFYDPLFTMKVTITGQMVLAMLVEQLLSVRGVRIIQANTDGITVYMPRAVKAEVDAKCAAWEAITRLTLESVEYRLMSIADVNSYLAVTVGGKVKRKGRYEHKVEWHQDSSCLVVPKVAEKVLVEGVPIRQTVEEWPEFMDFMIRTKVNRPSSLVLSVNGADVPLENTQRYYMSKEGHPMFKLMPPLAKAGPYAPRRRFAVQAGHKVCPCNNILSANKPIDFDWYVNEVQKLVLGVL